MNRDVLCVSAAAKKGANSVTDPPLAVFFYGIYGSGVAFAVGADENFALGAGDKAAGCKRRQRARTKRREISFFMLLPLT